MVSDHLGHAWFYLYCDEKAREAFAFPGCCSWWSRQGSNLRPFACKATALPLRHSTVFGCRTVSHNLPELAIPPRWKTGAAPL